MNKQKVNLSWRRLNTVYEKHCFPTLKHKYGGGSILIGSTASGPGPINITKVKK